MHRWKVGDDVWVRYYDRATDRYVARLLGSVTGVGPRGFTVRLSSPDHAGNLLRRFEFGDVVWPSREVAEVEIAKQPSPTVPSAPRKTSG